MAEKFPAEIFPLNHFIFPEKFPNSQPYPPFVVTQGHWNPDRSVTWSPMTSN